MRAIIHICPVCGAEFKGRMAQVYCSRPCSLTVYRPAWNKGRAGLPPNRQPNGQRNTCAHCAAAFYVPASASRRRYCSAACYYAHRWGDEHRQTRLCVICGAAFVCKASEQRTCCSSACRSQRKSDVQQGEHNHLWRGGRAALYGREWKLARSTVLERDGHKCILCGATERLSVHHIVPYRYCRHHQIENLVTLCRSCHSRSEIGVNEAVYEALRVLRWPHAQHDESAPVR